MIKQHHSLETCYHVTVQSNFARAYDKYRRRYCKAAISESRYPDKFFLLRREELNIGIEKATLLLKRLARPGDCLLVLKTTVASEELQPNLRTGLGRFVARDWIHVDEVLYFNDNHELKPQLVETVCARSFASLEQEFPSYQQLVPRSFSILPESIGCQASCPFCFSKASASLVRRQHKLTPEQVAEVGKEAKKRGAKRAVITGGGEPGMLEHLELEALIRVLSEDFEKTVLITNGFKWGVMDEQTRLNHLLRLDAAGLTVMAISRHHHSTQVNKSIMSLDTQSEQIANTWHRNRQRFRQLRLRWICVLQKGGVSDDAAVRGYVEWASRTGVQEICFKELYVSTSTESEYHDHKSNQWSRKNQVPLSLVTEFSDEGCWNEVGRLPWGAPLFSGKCNGQEMHIAAYTEPSLFWERHNKLCRSWNLMADGRCLASLEDRHSEVLQK